MQNIKILMSLHTFTSMYDKEELQILTLLSTVLFLVMVYIGLQACIKGPIQILLLLVLLVLLLYYLWMSQSSK